MNYVIYRTASLTLIKEYTYHKSALKYLSKLCAGYSLTDKATFLSLERPTKIVKSLMTGADVEIAVDTPHCCDPSTETYWSM